MIPSPYSGYTLPQQSDFVNTWVWKFGNSLPSGSGWLFHASKPERWGHDPAWLASDHFLMIVTSVGTFLDGQTAGGTAYEDGNVPCGTNP